MTEADAIAKWRNGVPCIPCVYVGGMAETIAWRDKTTGKALTAPVLKHNVIVGKAVMVVNERVPDTFDITKYVDTMKQGQKCLLTITELTNMRGVSMVRGSLEPLV